MKLLNEHVSADRMTKHECCLMHGSKHRAQFQRAVNLLRRTVGKKCLNYAKIGSIVCCCRLNQECSETVPLEILPAPVGDSEPPALPRIEDFFPGEELNDAMEFLLTSDEIPEQIKDSLRVFVNRNPENTSHVCYGNSRLAGIIKLCHLKVFDLLVNRNSKVALGQEVLLPMALDMVGRFFGAKGRNIKDLCIKLNFRIEVPKGQAENAGVTQMTVYCKADCFDEVKKQLETNARNVIEKWRLRPHPRPRYRRRFYDYSMVSPLNDHELSRKEADKDSYSRKFKGHQQEIHYKPQSKNLLERRCYYCLAVSDNLHKTLGECHYHPGYVQSRNDPERKASQYTKDFWSCCQAEFHDTDGVQESHRLSGCQQRSSHMWRQMKNPDKKRTFNSRFDDSYDDSDLDYLISTVVI